MATLQKIRNKAGLLVIVIGIALLAFIIGDFLNSGQAFFRMSQDKVVVVNGKKVTTQEWIDIVKTAHEVGIPGSATIMYGHVETPEERVEHIDIIRKIQ